MNLTISSLGAAHLAAALAALAAALVIVMMRQGHPAHKRSGRIYGRDGRAQRHRARHLPLGVFFFPHWFAIASLVTTAIAFAAAHFKRPRVGWVHIHLTMMLASVYILIGGGGSRSSCA